MVEGELTACCWALAHTASFSSSLMPASRAASNCFCFSRSALRCYTYIHTSHTSHITQLYHTHTNMFTYTPTHILDEHTPASLPPSPILYTMQWKRNVFLVLSYMIVIMMPLIKLIIPFLVFHFLQLRLWSYCV